MFKPEIKRGFFLGEPTTLVNDGEEVPASQKIICCDCGLTHSVKYRMNDGKLFLRFFRDEKETGIVRMRRQILVTSQHPREALLDAPMTGVRK